MHRSGSKPLVAIACGGTGGHLFPGIAVGEELMLRGCSITLLISPKDVDQQAVQNAMGMNVVTLPAVGLSRGQIMAFFRGSWNSFHKARAIFKQQVPQAVLAMGGFTSAPPVLAGKICGAATFIHESNIIPGRANRWLSYFVDQAFVGFPKAGRRLHNQRVTVTGTPVRQQFQPGSAASARLALGLDPDRPVLLITGGSQGASGINDLVSTALEQLATAEPQLQYLHLTGARDGQKMRARYQEYALKAVVRPYLTEMELALAAATIAVSRAGGSSLAELAAMQVPAILIPYPAAADDHQFYNARAFVESGAARMLGDLRATPENLMALIRDLLGNPQERSSIAEALKGWHAPDAAVRIAESILKSIHVPEVSTDEGKPKNGSNELIAEPPLTQNMPRPVRFKLPVSPAKVP